jgi:hypothetical protein
MNIGDDTARVATGGEVVLPGSPVTGTRIRSDQDASRDST